MFDFKIEQENVWDFLKKSNKPIYIYGMGNGADKVLGVFKEYEIECSGVMASDEFVRGQSFHGFKVQTLNSIKEKESEFIIAVTFGTQIPSVMEHIKIIAKNNTVVVPTVPVFGDVIMDNNFLQNNEYNINKVYNMLADEKSRKAFTCAMNFNYSGKLDYLWQSQTDKAEVFSNIIKLSKEENYLDLGAYRGDTIKEFLDNCGGQYASITALEPDEKTYKKLCDYAQPFENTTLLQQGIYSKCTELEFSNKGGRNSTLRSKESGKIVKVATIDSLAGENGFSYIKMDVEGAEKDALLGGAHTLRKYKPMLNVAAYHTFGDIFNLAIQINMINPNYKFYMRHHPYIPCWDTNLYCV